MEGPAVRSPRRRGVLDEDCPPPYTRLTKERRTEGRCRLILLSEHLPSGIAHLGAFERVRTAPSVNEHQAQESVERIITSNETTALSSYVSYPVCRAGAGG